MKRPVVAVLILVGSLLIPLAASADQIRAFVTEFTVSPAESGDLKNTLKRLLSSRLSGDGITPVDAPSEADVIVSGSFTQLGKIFSLDAVVKTAAGKPLATAFEQGDSPDSMIPAVGKISAKLKEDILKQYQQKAAAPLPAVTAAPLPAVNAAPSGDIVRQGVSTNWTSKRITGAKSSLAPGHAKDFFLAGGDSFGLYRQGASVALINEVKLPSPQKLLAVDSVQSGDQIMAFVSIMDRESPSSRVYTVVNDKLKLVAKDLPYLFRTIALNGGPKLLYAQETGRIEDFHGDLHEASFSNGSLKLKNPIKLPKFANIFNFNSFRDPSGNSYTTAFSEGGYLIVYSDKGEELWRSNEKFGGSENSFQRRHTAANEWASGVPFKSRFLDQRIFVTEKGEIIVPQNDGFFVLGDSRSYTKHSVVAFGWNGSALEERWRTKLSKNYLADYFYEPRAKELVLLEVVQKGGVINKGASTLRVIPVE